MSFLTSNMSFSDIKPATDISNNKPVQNWTFKPLSLLNNRTQPNGIL